MDIIPPASLAKLVMTSGRIGCGFWLLLLLVAAPAHAVDTVCARVKIEIKQELTLERQAFDAEMKINNTTDSSVIENVAVVVKVTDEIGTPVAVSEDPDDQSAQFFLRLSGKQNIGDVSGTGSVGPNTSAVINWLLIPAPGSAGSHPLGKKYRVGASLTYTYGGVVTTLEVSPDVITVKPLPLLTLDYFLPQQVWADDPLTPEVEPAEPFTLGVRVRNDGHAAAKSLKIDSAQPKIVENSQGLLINFLLTGSYVNDAPALNTLLLDFGEVAAGSAKTGRWIMETSLAGRFTEFTARFSHADELGGALTSIVQATRAHSLIRDVRVDLPGRDGVRDFLARDGDILRIYESDSTDTEVTDRSGATTVTAGVNGRGNASYRLNLPATSGFLYVKLPDPFGGQKPLGTLVRADGKVLGLDNVWLSKSRNPQSKQWEHWLNLFDANTPGVYDAEYQAPPPVMHPPVLQFIADRIVTETQKVSFLVEASSPDGKPVTLSAAPLPAGASFAMQPADPEAPGVARTLFDWTPATGQAASYLIEYTATDGILTARRSARITVNAPPSGPATPTVVAPLSGAQLASLKPTLSVQAGTDPSDPATQIQFELYGDEAMTQPVAGALVDKAADLPGTGGGPVPQPTLWTVPADLGDNTPYWWRARAFDGALYSPWINARFFVNRFNDPPESFNLTDPAPGSEVASATPTLSWTNSSDKDGDAVSYDVTIYNDPELTDVVAQASDLAGDAGGTTSWAATVALLNHGTYYWRVVAKDPQGAQTPAAARAFVVDTGNAAPTTPLIQSPPAGGQSSVATTELTIHNSTDADHDPLDYVFEIDTVRTFDSADKRSSGPVVEGAGGSTAWRVSGLLENRRYWWRVKAGDGRSDSAWVVGDFLMNAANEAPPAPTLNNPGSGAWSASLQPSLEAHPVLDPEGDAVRYQFEVYRDAGLSQKLAAGISADTSWRVPLPLADQSTYRWRVRALDPQDAASAWSPAAVLYVSSGSYQPPTIAVTAPATLVVPTQVTTPGGNRKQVTVTCGRASIPTSTPWWRCTPTPPRTATTAP